MRKFVALKSLSGLTCNQFRWFSNKDKPFGKKNYIAILIDSLVPFTYTATSMCAQQIQQVLQTKQSIPTKGRAPADQPSVL